ncbi:hypothetical protein DPMN_088283 [Dreissena polymorpha]|uniref:Uncharacterized protein n=1 Tax=Dreissena polymorpha TaxID=45954 RepID=A0A9D4KUR6_DREPO|nr:hypothetical protein DPMN_088283 [Dreissena polymorpha]
MKNVPSAGVCMHMYCTRCKRSFHWSDGIAHDRRPLELTPGPPPAVLPVHHQPRDGSSRASSAHTAWPPETKPAPWPREVLHELVDAFLDNMFNA